MCWFVNVCSSYLITLGLENSFLFDRKRWSSITKQIRSNRNSTPIGCQITRPADRPHNGWSGRFFQFWECKTRPGHVMVMTWAQFWLWPGGAQGRGRTKNTPPPFVRSPRPNCYNYSDGFVRPPLPLGVRTDLPVHPQPSADSHGRFSQVLVLF